MTTQEYPVRVDEHNGLLHAYCPNCSKMYPVEDTDHKQLDLPVKCSRCGSPMDDQRALAFSEEQAKAYGKGMKSPPRTTQMRPQVTK